MRIAFCLLLPAVIATACTNFVAFEETPKNQIISKEVFASDATAEAAINGIYSEMMRQSDFASGGLQSVTLLAGLSSEELSYTGVNHDLIAFHTPSLQPHNTVVKSGLWDACYRYVYYANAVIEGVANAAGLSDLTARRLEGEARFIRAFCYFYLTNLFGSVPLIDGTDYHRNRIAGTAADQELKEFILSDLKRSLELLPEDFPRPGRERPGKLAAKALLARVYLFTGDWQAADALASQVIDNQSLKLEPDLSHVFLATSGETIWQLRPVIPGINTKEAGMFISGGLPTAILGESVLFEQGDKRGDVWVGTGAVEGRSYRFPYKYKVVTASAVTECSVVLRLSEQYLIRAEARFRLGQTELATADLNVVRRRAGLIPLKPYGEEQTLLDEIEGERVRELFSEWGHRWLDLKRYGKTDEVLTPLKPGWKPFYSLYPVPQSETEVNPAIRQNTGY